MAENNTSNPDNQKNQITDLEQETKNTETTEAVTKLNQETKKKLNWFGIATGVVNIIAPIALMHATFTTFQQNKEIQELRKEKLELIQKVENTNAITGVLLENLDWQPYVNVECNGRLYYQKIVTKDDKVFMELTPVNPEDKGKPSNITYHNNGAREIDSFFKNDKEYHVLPIGNSKNPTPELLK